MSHGFNPPRIFCPGPTPVPTQVAQQSLNTEIYHRSEEFKSIFLRTRDQLDQVFRGDTKPLILTSSGTGAMESAVVNLTNPGDAVLVIEGGKFGQRWTKLNESYRCNTKVYHLEWGSSIDLDHLESLVKSHKNLKAVFLQANETSTGVAYPIAKIVPIIKKHSDALVVVDAISGLIAQNLPMSDLGVDCLLSGSQKGFGVPPGLAFVALSKNAWDQISTREKFYFDLKKEATGQEKGLSAWTPATTLIRSLSSALDIILETGLGPIAEFHRICSEACQKAAVAMGLEVFSRADHSTSLTAIALPSGVDGQQLIRHAREKHNTIFAGGQDHLKGKIVRVAHLGLIDEFSLLTAIAVLERSLVACGYNFRIGSGLQAAQEHFSKSL